MTIAFAIILVFHGLIHLLGFAKAFGWAELPQLTQPISPLLGVAWLMAALLFFAAAGSLFVWPRWWWAIGASAVLVSMLAIVPSWIDARFGALGNLMVLVGVGFGFLAQGPTSLRAAYERDVDQALTHTHTASVEPIVDADLAHLPDPYGGIYARPASSGSLASATFAYACTGASATVPRRDGSR